MIQVRDNRGNYHETVAIYDGSGKEIAEVRDNQGRLLFKNWNEIQGSPPITFRGYGKNLTECRIYGNTVQNGTPSPEAPVDVVGCGVRTGNLFDITAFVQGIVPNRCTTSYDSTTNTLTIDSNGSDAHTGNENTYHIPVTGGETYNLGWTTNPPGGDVYIFENGLTDSSHLHVFNSSLTNGTVTMKKDTTFIIVRFGCYAANVTKTYTNIILNFGRTALPYEPYGYKLPLTINGTEHPIYLGQVETTRRIKKFVLTGKETFYKNYYESTNYLYYAEKASIFPSAITRTPVFCNELPVKTESPISDIGINTNNDFRVIYFNFGSEIMNAQPSGNTASGLREYLNQQYQNGTPVTIWCVLGNPTTAIVNEPLQKIGDYSDELSIADIPTINGINTISADTTVQVQPSEMYIKGKIKSIT